MLVVVKVCDFEKCCKNLKFKCIKEQLMWDLV